MNQVLLEELYHPDAGIRSRAAINLGNDVSAVDALIQALAAETDVAVREDITWALVRMGDVALLPLICLLIDGNSAGRHHAAHTLGKIGDARAVGSLIDALQDSEITVKLKVMLALGQIGDDRAVPALVGLLGSENPDIQSMVVNVLEGFGEAAVEPLIQTLGHEQWQVREQAAEILGIIGSRDSETALIGALEDAEWQVRFAAVNALASLGGKNVKAALQQMDNDADTRVRGLAVKVAGRLRG